MMTTFTFSDGTTVTIPGALVAQQTATAEESRAGVAQHNLRCLDCGAFEALAKRGAHTVIRHTRRCETPDAQIVRSVAAATVATPGPSAAEFRRAARDGEAGRYEGDLVGAVACGLISPSDAMNRDF